MLRTQVYGGDIFLCIKLLIENVIVMYISFGRGWFEAKLGKQDMGVQQKRDWWKLVPSYKNPNRICKRSFAKSKDQYVTPNKM